MKRLSPESWSVLFLGSALVLGALVRFLPALMTDFPVNDGGMFYQMILDLKANGYRMPAVTSYNHWDIPFAYPPLGFYLAAVLTDILPVGELVFLRWFPPLVTIFSIAAFHRLALALLKSRPRAALAAVFFAFTPGLYAWQVMGGGLSRSLGTFFSLLAMSSLLRLLTVGSKRDFLLGSLFCALAVLSHPESGTHLLMLGIMFWLAYGRSVSGTLRAFMLALGVLSLTAPWWVSVMHQHGITPFKAVLHSGGYAGMSLLPLSQTLVRMDGFLPVLLIFRLLGILVAVCQRRFFLLLWVLLPFFVDPRSAGGMASFPLTMLAALGFIDGLMAFLLHRRQEKVDEPDLVHLATSPRVTLAVLVMALCLFVDAGLFGFRLVNTTLTAADRQVMNWAKEHTPAGSRFVIVTGKSGIMSEPLQEWFPALAERRSQTTLQGLEWVLAGQFTPRLDGLIALQACDSADCVEAWSERAGLEFEYALLQKATLPESLLTSFLNSPHYQVIYDNECVIIFQQGDFP